MKKKLLIILGVLVGLFVLALVGAIIFFGNIASKGVQEVGPMVTKTPCKLEGASLNPLTGSCSLNGFEVGNPEGFKQPHAFKFDSFLVQLQPSSLLSDTIIVEEVRISGTQINYEGLTGDNLNQLKKNIDEFVAKNAPAEGQPKTEDKPSEGGGKKVVIKHIYIENSSLLIGSLNTPVPLPPLHLTDIGGSGTDAKGASMGEAIQEIYDSLLKSISSAATGALKGIGDAITDGVKGLFGQ